MYRKAALLLVAWLIGGCQALQVQPRTTLPPQNAEPAEVAANFLQALVDGDCAKARALMTTDGTAFQQPWCARPRVTGFSELTRDAGIVGETEADYAVGLTVEGTDISLGDGEHTMFVQVLRQPNGAWRVTGLGTGP